MCFEKRVQRYEFFSLRFTVYGLQMITIKQYIGIALVVAGALLLLISKIVGWTSSNLVLLSGLALIVLGVILHVKLIKSAEKY